MSFKVMLACSDSPDNNPEYFENLQFPLYASAKLDGIRMVVKEADQVDFHHIESEGIVTKRPGFRCRSRTFLDIPNERIQERFAHLHHMDGELIHGTEYDHDVYNRTQSTVMSQDKASDDVIFHVFDYTAPEALHLPFYKRIDIAETILKGQQYSKIVQQQLCETVEQVLAYESKMLEMGYEGLILKSPLQPYKHGRSTYKQGGMYKLKRSSSIECKVVGLVEQMVNNNELEQSELGYAKRSESKSGLALANTLGAFQVEYNGEVCPVSCGVLTHAQRKEIWDNPLQYIGQEITIKHFAHGAKDKLRFPRFVGWRKKGF